MDGLAQRKRCQGCGHVRGMGEMICENCGWASFTQAFVPVDQSETEKQNHRGAENERTLSSGRPDPDKSGGRLRAPLI